MFFTAIECECFPEYPSILNNSPKVISYVGPMTREKNLDDKDDFLKLDETTNNRNSRKCDYEYSALRREYWLFWKLPKIKIIATSLFKQELIGLFTLIQFKANQSHSHSKRPKMSSFSLTCLFLLLVKLCAVDGFAAPFGIGALLFQPKGLVTESTDGNVPALLEASDFFIEAFWVGKVGGGATE